MATFNHPFGQADKTKRAQDTNDTPQQKKFEKATGKDSDSATGDVSRKTVETTKKNTTNDGNKTGKPSGVSQETWDAAEQIALSKYGGFSGVSPERKQEMIKEILEQQNESIKQTEKWEGK